MTDQVEYDHHAELKEVKREIEDNDRRLAKATLEFMAAQAHLTALHDMRKKLDFQAWRLEKQYKTEGSM